MDVDISKKGGDSKTVLNENVDLFSAGFRTYTKSAKPGETIPVEILVQSQASLTIDLTLDSRASLDQKSFEVRTNQSSEYQSLVVNANAPTSGSYDINLTAKARNCSLASCTRQGSMKLLVSVSEPQEGFAVSIFPENLAIKNLEPVSYAFTLQNSYKDEANFVVNVQAPLELDSSFVLGNFTVPGLSEKIVNFTVTPRNQTGFYEIRVSASLNDVEKIAYAYLSTNEMVSDVYRNADEAWANANSSTRAGIDKNVKSWYSSYSKDEYGSNTAGYASLQDSLDAARKQNQSQSAKPPPAQPYIPEDDQEAQPNPLSWILIPILLGGIAFVVIMIFRRKQKTEDGEVLESI
jgi:ribosomal protein L11